MGIANLKGVTKVPEPNGDHIVQVVLESGETIEATLSPDFAVVLVHVLQPGIVERADKLAESLSLPMLDVHRYSLAHGRDSSELMAHIEQMGTLILRSSDETLRGLRKEVDRLLSLRKTREKKH